MKRQLQKQNKLVHFIKAPIRIMCKARDFYVKSMDDFAGRVGNGGGVGGPAAHVTTLPKSFSVNSSRTIQGDDDFRELVRAASTREGGRQELHNLYQQQSERHRTMNNQQNNGVFGPNGVGRSYSVGIGKIGRIDEDRTCEFEEDDQFNVNKNNLYPRSRSHAVNGRSVGFH